MIFISRREQINKKYFSVHFRKSEYVSKANWEQTRLAMQYTPLYLTFESFEKSFKLQINLFVLPMKIMPRDVEMRLKKLYINFSGLDAKKDCFFSLCGRKTWKYSTANQFPQETETLHAGEEIHDRIQRRAFPRSDPRSDRSLLEEQIPVAVVQQRELLQMAQLQVDVLQEPLQPHLRQRHHEQLLLHPDRAGDCGEVG